MTADPSQLTKIKEIGRPGALMSIARFANSTRVLLGSSDFNVYDLDLAADKPEPIPMAGHSSYVTGVVLAGGNIISAGWDGRLIWWDIETHQPTRTIEAHSKWIRKLVASPDGTWVASVGDDMVCRRWDAQSGERLAELVGHDPLTPHHYPSMLFAVTVSSDGQYLATADKQGKALVWEVASGKQVAQVEAAEMYTWDPNQRRHSIGGARSVAFSADGSLLAVGGMGKVGNIDHLGGKTRVEIFDWQKGEQTHEFIGDAFKGLIEHLQFHPTQPWLLAAGGDHGGVISLFDIQAKTVLKEEKAPSHIHAVAVDENWETLYCAGHGKLTLWEMKAVYVEGAPPEPTETAPQS